MPAPTMLAMMRQTSEKRPSVGGPFGGSLSDGVGVGLMGGLKSNRSGPPTAAAWCPVSYRVRSWRSTSIVPISTHWAEPYLAKTRARRSLNWLFWSRSSLDWGGSPV